MSQLRHHASLKQNKGGGPFKLTQIQLHKELKISSCCDIWYQKPQIRNLTVYLLPLPDKKTTTAVVKCDKTSRLDRNNRQIWSRLQHTLVRKGSIKYCLLLLWIFLASHDYAVYEIMSVCMCVKQQTDDLYIIICNCVYSVVINCGWNRGLHRLKIEARTRPVPEIVWPDPSGTVIFRARTQNIFPPTTNSQKKKKTGTSALHDPSYLWLA